MKTKSVHFKSILFNTTLIILVSNTLLPGQVKQLNSFYGNKPYNGDICVKAGNFTQDLDVENLVGQILDKYGFKNRFVVAPCDRTSNCQAILDERGRPYILYNPDFLNKVKSLSFTSTTLPAAEPDWKSLTILAHEIGHHLNFHLISPHPDATQRSMELEADETAGHIMYLLGATLEEAQRVMHDPSVPVQGSMTHPPRAQRLAAIEQGYRQAEQKFPRNMPQPLNPWPNPVKDEVDLRQYNMVRVKGGNFTMGCSNQYNQGECGKDESPQREITLTDFYIGKYEVTQKEWFDIMGYNPSEFKGCEDCPVEKVSWTEIQEFISRLNAKTGNQYRLPTEAEWEYAARGGSKSQDFKFSGSNTIEDVAWYKGNSGSKTQPVGKKSPNELGLYDMSGNVFEWCQDWYTNYSLIPNSDNPVGPSTGLSRVRRGGSWFQNPVGCRVTDRDFYAPNTKFYDFGFRLARNL